MDELKKRYQFFFEMFNEANKRMIEAIHRGDDFWIDAYNNTRKQLNAELHVLASKIAQAEIGTKGNAA